MESWDLTCKDIIDKKAIINKETLAFIFIVLIGFHKRQLIISPLKTNKTNIKEPLPLDNRINIVICQYDSFAWLSELSREMKWIELGIKELSLMLE